MKPEDFIVDLYELKSKLVRPFDFSKQFVEPNVTYVIIETLIAVFSDKYNVKCKDIEEAIQRRHISSNK